MTIMSTTSMYVNEYQEGGYCSVSSYEISNSGWIKLLGIKSHIGTNDEYVFNVNNITRIKNTGDNSITIDFNGDKHSSLTISGQNAKQFYKEIQTRLMGFTL